MVAYDAQIIYRFADKLYQQANQVIATSTIIGALIGLAGGYYLQKSLGLYAVLGAVVLGLIGYVIGTQRAFALKLQAQIALCQVKVEENTRKA